MREDDEEKILVARRRKRLNEASGRWFDGNEAALARAVERAPSQISDMIHGRKSFGSKIARVIERKLSGPPYNMPFGWLDWESDPDVAVHTFPSNGPTAPGYIRLPVLAEAAAGPGIVVHDDPEVVRFVEVLESWVRETLRTNPSRLRILTARGHSMSGVVEHGDVLFVEPCTEFNDDGLYVLSVGDLLRIKRLRLRITDRQLSIESTDGSAPEMVPLSLVGDSVRIQGRVIGSWGLKRF